MSNVNNVFDAILKYGHDEDFMPEDREDFEPTDAPAGSDEKIAILRRRIEQGSAAVARQRPPGLQRSDRRRSPARVVGSRAFGYANEKGYPLGIPLAVSWCDIARAYVRCVGVSSAGLVERFQFVAQHEQVGRRFDPQANFVSRNTTIVKMIESPSFNRSLSRRDRTSIGSLPEYDLVTSYEFMYITWEPSQAAFAFRT